jgi:staphylococcal nuclease domain-containing protein 1
VEFQLALVKPPVDEDSMAIALDQFISKIMGDQTFSVNDENMKEGNTYQVTLMSKDGVDIGEELLKNGFCTTVKKAPKHLAELHSTYVEVQSVAKKQHLNLWRYGDITEDDDKEFGMNNETVKAK